MNFIELRKKLKELGLVCLREKKSYEWYIGIPSSDMTTMIKIRGMTDEFVQRNEDFQPIYDIVKKESGQ